MKVIGIDGGGTKTKFCLFDESGNILKEETLPSAHILSNRFETCVDILSRGVHLLCNNQDVMIVAGLAGYGKQAEVRKKIEDVCQQAFKGYQYSIYNDIDIATEAALDGKDGIVIIAGTGSIAYAKVRGELHRCGGWGYQLGDEGSGYWIGKKVLDSYCRQVDGRQKRGRLYQLLYKELEFKNDYDMIRYVSKIQGDRRTIASLARFNYEAALANDLQAIDIYQQAAYELSLLVRQLSTHFSKQFPVSYIGGVFNAKEYVLKPFEEFLKDIHCDVLQPLHSPEYGAYLLAKKNIENDV